MAPSQHKVIFLGDTAVGKTSIVNRIVYGGVNAQHQPTVGIDFFAQTVIRGDKPIRLQIWDTAGQEKFRSLIPSYIRNATVAVFVYDITNQASFDNLKTWHAHTLTLSSPACVVVGNKVDLESARAVPTANGKEYADSISAGFFETSAVAPLNVQELFDAIADIPAPDAAQASEVQPAVEKVDLGKIAPQKPAGGCAC
jgi:Ras-related protein Rab-6A